MLFKKVLNFLPLAKLYPSEKFLDFFEEQVRNKSPSPDNPDSVSSFAPSLPPSSLISEKLLEMTDATAFSPKFFPTITPHPIA